MLGRQEQLLLVVLLFVLMLGMGATLTLDSFRMLARRPRAMLVGLVAQFTWMPLLAFVLARAIGLSNEAAIGLVVVGSCPGGSTSNMYTYFAKGDVALSIAMTALTTLGALAVMPVLLFAYATPFTSAALTIPYQNVLQGLLIMLVPVALGVLLRRLKPRLAQGAERAGSRAGALVIVLLTGSMLWRNRGMFAEVAAGEWLGAALLGVGGLVLGHLTARAAGLAIGERRAIAIEVAVQNSALALGVILSSFPAQPATAMTRIVLLYAIAATLSVGAAAWLYRVSASSSAPYPQGTRKGIVGLEKTADDRC